MPSSTKRFSSSTPMPLRWAASPVTPPSAYSTRRHRGGCNRAAPRARRRRRHGEPTHPEPAVWLNLHGRQIGRFGTVRAGSMRGRCPRGGHVKQDRLDDRGCDCPWSDRWRSGHRLAPKPEGRQRICELGREPRLLQRGLAGGAKSEIGTLEHFGRMSGVRRLTPVHPEPTPAGFRVMVPLGSHSQWARNVLAAGHCRLQLHDVVYNSTSRR